MVADKRFTRQNFMKQALAYAGAIGKVQGLLEFLNNNPDVYSANEIITRLNEYVNVMEDELKDEVTE
jgi:Mor family transcriptional regulator